VINKLETVFVCLGVILIGVIASLAIVACGQLPSVELINPVTVTKKIPATNTDSVACPDGMAAKGATMSFHMNGEPDTLSVVCYEMRTKP